MKRPRAAPPRRRPNPNRTRAEALLVHARRLADRRSGQPRAGLRRQPAQRRLPRRRGAGAALGPAEGQEEVRRRADRGPHGPGRPARRGPAPADVHERVRSLRRVRRAARTSWTSIGWWSCTTRSTCRSARSASRLGGGLAGHNGLKSLRRDLGAPDFHRVRVGVGRPDSTDPDIVAAYVLGKWRQPAGRGGRAGRRAPATRSSGSCSQADRRANFNRGIKGAGSTAARYRVSSLSG